MQNRPAVFRILKIFAVVRYYSWVKVSGVFNLLCYFLNMNTNLASMC